MIDKEEFQKKIENVERKAYLALFFSLIASVLLLFTVYDPTFSIFENKSSSIDLSEDEDKIENGIHLRTGLIEAEGLMTVVNNCTNCHSAKLVIQNKMSAESWNTAIKWMQETQNLWDLGDNQKIIVNYLVTNYPIKAKGRRMNLKKIDWYELEN